MDRLVFKVKVGAHSNNLDLPIVVFFWKPGRLLLVIHQITAGYPRKCDLEIAHVMTNMADTAREFVLTFGVLRKQNVAFPWNVSTNRPSVWPMYFIVQI